MGSILVDISTRLEQCASAPLVPILGSDHQCGEALVLLGLQAGARLDQVENDLLKVRRRLT